MAKKAIDGKKTPFLIWTVFLIKPERADDNGFLSPKVADSLMEHIVSLSATENASLYVKKVPDITPPWVKRFSGIATPPVNAKSRSAAAILVVKSADRTFVLTFGFGRSLVDSEAWEQEFGLKVVLNNIHEDRIRQIESGAFDAILQNKQAHAVRDANIDEFGLDVEQEVIRSLVGEPLDKALGREIGGRDSVHLSSQIKLQELPALLKRLLEDSEKDTYLKTFPWIGRMKEIRAKPEKTKLDSLLVEKLQEEDFNRMWLAPVSYTEWSAGCVFEMPFTSEAKTDIHIKDFIDSMKEKGKLESLEVEQLRRWKIQVVDDNGTERDSWSVYKCIYCEVDHDGDTYLLNNGLWYCINKDYLDEVDDEMKAFPICGFTLPAFNDAAEGDYNKRLHDEQPQRFALMDTDCIELKARGFTKIEFCDLYTNDRKMIHVKRYSGSSELSHLFAQGIVPAELFLNVPEFRQKVTDKLPKDFKLADPNAKISAQDFEVVYAVISKSTSKLNLPLFSKVMLRQARRALEGLGFKVSLCKVSNEQSASKPKPKKAKALAA
jgi:uncharacterized protein (TIGR04141 family)